MTTISLDDARKLAQLSALPINDEQAQKIADELSEILGYVAKLDEVDTSGVEPTFQVTGLENVTRTDEIIDYGVSQADLMKNAPHQKDGQFLVPRVIE